MKIIISRLLICIKTVILHALVVGGVHPVLAQFNTSVGQTFAGTLDDRARVLFVPLDRNFWAAYDLELGDLYKVWEGSFENSPVHPSSFLAGKKTIDGVAFLEQDGTQHWRVIRNGVEEVPEVEYLGYRFSGGQLVISYEISTVYGYRIRVDEQPSVIYSPDGRRGIRRRFFALNTPEGVNVALDVELSMLQQTSDIKTRGFFHRRSAKKHSFYWGDTFELEGRLMLNAVEPASLEMVFSPHVAKNTGTNATTDAGYFTPLRTLKLGDSLMVEPWLKRRKDHDPGIALKVYGIGEPIEKIAELAPGQLPSAHEIIDSIDLSGRGQFGGLDFYFISHLTGFLNIAASGTYQFQVIADDGIRFSLRDSVLFEHNGLKAAVPSDVFSVQLDAGVHPLKIEHFQSTGKKQLTVLWQPPWSNKFDVLDAPTLSTRMEEARFSSPGRKFMLRPEPPDSLGDRRIVVDKKHPTLDIEKIEIAGIGGTIGGMGYLSNGQLVVTVGGARGKLLVLDGELEEPERIVVKSIAEGLNFPLGLKIVDDELFVQQRHELTHLIDNDGNETIDEFRVVSKNWELTTDYQELSFGLEYKQGAFYSLHGMPLDRDGAILIEDILHRGVMVEVGFDGETRQIADGLQIPNGIAFGMGGMLAVSDQRNPWFSDSRLLFGRVAEGALDEAEDERMFSIWIPQALNTTAPTQPFQLSQGAFSGQWLVGDSEAPTLNRFFVEEVDGAIQGAIFPFSGDMPFPINRVVRAPDGSLVMGRADFEDGKHGIEKSQSALVRMHLDEKRVFEMKTVEAVPSGFDISFTQEIDGNQVLNPSMYHVYQWPNSQTKLDRSKRKGDIERLEIVSIEKIDEARLRIEIEGLKEGQIVYFNLDPRMKAGNLGLWSNEAWYSLNRMPGPELGSR